MLTDAELVVSRGTFVPESEVLLRLEDVEVAELVVARREVLVLNGLRVLYLSVFLELDLVLLQESSLHLLVSDRGNLEGCHETLPFTDDLQGRSLGLVKSHGASKHQGTLLVSQRPQELVADGFMRRPMELVQFFLHLGHCLEGSFTGCHVLVNWVVSLRFPVRNLLAQLVGLFVELLALESHLWEAVARELPRHDPRIHLLVIWVLVLRLGVFVLVLDAGAEVRLHIRLLLVLVLHEDGRLLVLHRQVEPVHALLPVHLEGTVGAGEAGGRLRGLQLLRVQESRLLLELGSDLGGDHARDGHGEQTRVHLLQQHYPVVPHGLVVDIPSLFLAVVALPSSDSSLNLFNSEGGFSLVLVHNPSTFGSVLEHFNQYLVFKRQVMLLDKMMYLFNGNSVVQVLVERVEQVLHHFKRNLQHRVFLVQVLWRTIVSLDLSDALGHVGHLGLKRGLLHRRSLQFSLSFGLQLQDVVHNGRPGPVPRLLLLRALLLLVLPCALLLGGRGAF